MHYDVRIHNASTGSDARWYKTASTSKGATGAVLLKHDGCEAKHERKYSQNDLSKYNVLKRVPLEIIWSKRVIFYAGMSGNIIRRMGSKWNPAESNVNDESKHKSSRIPTEDR